MRTQFDLWMKDGWKELFGDKPDGKRLDQFYRYYELLIQWNKVMNLTAITEMDQVVTKHFWTACRWSGQCRNWAAVPGRCWIWEPAPDFPASR